MDKPLITLELQQLRAANHTFASVPFPEGY